MVDEGCPRSRRRERSVKPGAAVPATPSSRAARHLPRSVTRELAREPAAVRVYDQHGGALYALASVLTGDSLTAEEVVVRVVCAAGAAASPGVPAELCRDLARSVYVECNDLGSRGSARSARGTRIVRGPAARLVDLSTEQRAALALAMFGGADYHWVADVMGLTPAEVAEHLRDGLRSLGDAAG